MTIGCYTYNLNITLDMVEFGRNCHKSIFCSKIEHFRRFWVLHPIVIKLINKISGDSASGQIIGGQTMSTIKLAVTLMTFGILGL